MAIRELILPWAPGVNHLYATVNGHRVLSRAGREYKKSVAYEILSVQCRLERHTMMTGPLRATIHLYPPSRRHGRYDIDGKLKIILDALGSKYGKVYKDDTQIEELHIYKHQTPLDGKVLVRIEELSV